MFPLYWISCSNSSLIRLENSDSTISNNSLNLEPVGMIVMWHGPLTSLPEGWTLCNGSNGSPDLRNRFILGVSEGEDPGATGGSSSPHNHTYTMIPNHTHGIIDPGHDHDPGLYLQNSTSAGLWVGLAGNDIAGFGTQTRFAYTGISINSEGVDLCSTDSASSLPPYYKLAFIMKVNETSNLPVGAIILWSETLASIPDGYALCNGSNGTPDLQDKFTLGVTDGEDPGATGGALSHNHTYSMLPNHTHGIIDPGHQHYLQSSSSSTPGMAPAVVVSKGNLDLNESTNLAQSNIGVNHTGEVFCSTDSASSLPPYQKLAFIMKIAETCTLPPKGIFMWSKLLSSVPNGYAFCNGSGGTPDLQDKFILGVTNGEDPGAIGGVLSHNHTYSMVPNHTHGVIDPGHKHYVNFWVGSGFPGADCIDNYIDMWSCPTNVAFTGITLTYTGVESPSTNNTTVLPPYTKLAFIQKESIPDEGGIPGFQLFYIAGGLALVAIFYLENMRRHPQPCLKRE